MLPGGVVSILMMNNTRLITTGFLLISMACSYSSAYAQAVSLKLPPQQKGTPGAGKRVKITPVEYAGTQVYHSLYLPTDWSVDWRREQKKWPVIVEYTGNKFQKAGSTGKVDDAGLGFGISQGKFIWVVLPYISKNKCENELTWWGDEKATVNYAKRNVPLICQEYGGDVDKVLICGFSRGAIGVNYIGLHDDEIAKLWCGFISHDHYDGVKAWRGTTWGSRLNVYQKAAGRRLKRVGNRPVLIMQNPSTAEIQKYLSPMLPADNFTFLDVRMNEIFSTYPNKLAVHPHNDRWLLIKSQYQQQVHTWVKKCLSQ